VLSVLARIKAPSWICKIGEVIQISFPWPETLLVEVKIVTGLPEEDVP